MRLGSWITVPHPSVVDLMARQPSFDWLCVDLEHSPVSRVDLQMAVSIIQGKGKKAFARIAENSHLEAKYPLDAGIDGIIIPQVNSAEEARRAVESCRYPPEGRRGVGLARAQGYGFAFNEHLKHNRESLEIIVQIEHARAVEQLDQILEIDAIAGVFVGPYDLSGSMGIPGQFEHPDMRAAIDKVSRLTLQAKKILGAHVIPADWREVRRFEGLGYNFVAFSIDTYFMGQKVRDELDLLAKKH